MRSHRVVTAYGVASAAAGLVGLLLVAGTGKSSLGPGGSGAAPPAPPALPKPPDTLTPAVLAEADFAEQNDGEKDRPFFDDFSWKNFIALNWPADPDRHSVPHPTRPFGDTSGPLVWGSWKSALELFPLDPVRNPPTPWDDFNAVLAVRGPARDGQPGMSPLQGLPAQDPARVKVLAKVSKLEDASEAGFGSLEYPLVAQNKTFVRYEIHMNRLAYDFVRDHRYYLKQNLPAEGAPKLEFPDEAVLVKAAWRELPEDEEVRKHFYHVPAKVVDWKEDGTPVLLDRTVGLVGLHIVHKTPRRANWIWSTFEHVDNTVRSPGGVSPPSFNSKDAGMAFTDPGTNQNPDPVVPGKPLPKDPKPVEVARKTPIQPTTEQINQLYRNHPQVKDTVWRNYQLVVTQWPTPPGNGPGFFPKANVANVTMETYHQENGCINCHRGAVKSKLVYFLEMRAADAGSGQRGVPAAAAGLRERLKTSRDKPAGR